MLFYQGNIRDKKGQGRITSLFILYSSAQFISGLNRWEDHDLSFGLFLYVFGLKN